VGGKGLVVLTARFGHPKEDYRSNTGPKLDDFQL
jgi:hypothetical protein